jgi:hypothetical protein
VSKYGTIDGEIPPFTNLAWWVEDLRIHRGGEFAFISTWQDKARELVSTKARKLKPEYCTFWDRTLVVVAWCDAHPEIRSIDPAPFQVLADLLWRKFHDEKVGGLKEALAATSHPIQRLWAASFVWRQRFVAELKNPTDRLIIEVLQREHPRVVGEKELAKACGCTKGNIRRRLQEHMPVRQFPVLHQRGEDAGYCLT